MSEPAFLTYGGERVTYIIRSDPARSARIAIHVEADGSVIVDAPQDASPNDIRLAVDKRGRWVFAQIQRAKDRFRHVRPKTYVSGEEVLYLGRRYVLKVLRDAEDRQPVRLRGNRLEVACTSGSPEVVRARLWAWYRVKARDYFDRRLSAWESRLTWVSSRPPFRLHEMEKRWGSCTASGEIILNPHLVKAPRECVDYVILHELAHLRHHNHGPEFWQTVARADPDWARKKCALDDAVERLILR